MIIKLITDEPVFARAFLSYTNSLSRDFKFIDNESVGATCLFGVLIDGENLTASRLKTLLKKYPNIPAFLIQNSIKKIQNPQIVAYFDSGMSKKNILNTLKIFYGVGHHAVVPNSALSFNIFEQVVLDKLSQGQSNKEIARHLDAPLSRVKYAVTRILKKLGVSNRTQVALITRQTIL